MATIAAIATAYSHHLSGGIGIIRISGDKALEIMTKIFKPIKKVDSYEPRYLYYGHFLDENSAVIDEGLAVFMKAPFSYTAEDTVEFHCHGNPNLLTGLLQTCFYYGAELAEAGEFTKRAFLHGRLDLSQAEAVAELINAPTFESSKLAQAKLSGHLGQKIKTLRTNLETIMQNLLYELDFSEEDFADLSGFKTQVCDISSQINNLLLAYERAVPWRDGSLLVLAGKVNAGKSSLFNALLGRYRAIVTEQAGTTRDYIEELLKIQDIPVRLVDTAGIRKKEETNDCIEFEGIQSAYRLFEEATMILYLLDVESNFKKDKENIAYLKELNPSARVLLIWNKSDIKVLDESEEYDIFDEKVYNVSAKYGEGLEELAKTVHEELSSFVPKNDILAPNIRQARVLERANKELNLFRQNADIMPPDALALHVAEAVKILGEITGEIVTEDIVNSIFESFCVGK